MATNYSKNGLRTMDDVRSFRDRFFNTNNTNILTNKYIEDTIDKTITIFDSCPSKRLDRAVALIWKLESLCDETHLKAYANIRIEELVVNLWFSKHGMTEAPFDIKFASVLWRSQFDDKESALIDDVDACVIQKIGFLLERQPSTQVQAIDLKNTIKNNLSINGYNDFISYLP